MYYGETFTLTFTECSENHVGMQQIGQKLQKGLGNQVSDLEILFNFYKNSQYTNQVELHRLNYEVFHEPAAILIIRNGLELLGINHDSLFMEQKLLDKDKKALMKGRVVNKLARWNLCFADFQQDPCYEMGRGTVVPFSKVPITNILKERLHLLLGTNITSNIITAEGNYYYNKSCGINYHGDTERLKVIGVRFGDPMNLCFRWYYNWKIASEIFTICLFPGDIYIMSEKAVGSDWKKPSIYTLRHSAGSDVYTNPPSK